MVARRQHHRLHPRGGCRTATCASASPSTCSPWTTRRRCPGCSRSPTGSPARSRTPSPARACSSSAGTGDPVGHARLFRVPLDTGVPVDLTGSLDRNVMPGAPAYPGGLPQETADGRILFCLRERGCTHLWSVAADGSDARAVLDGAGRVVSGLAVAGDLAVVALGTPTSYGELAVVDVTAAARDRADRARCCFRRHRAVRACRAHLHHQRRHRGAGVAGAATPITMAHGTAAAPGRHPRRPAQRLERSGRRDPLLPPGAGRARLGDPARQPSRQRRLRRGVLRRGARRVGRRGRQRLPRAHRPARRRGARRPGAAGGRRLQLRRLHDLLPDRPRRPVRGGGGRRSRQRPGQHGRHLRRRPLPLGLRARAARRGRARPGTQRCRR